jgi:hypothetical protein
VVTLAGRSEEIASGRDGSRWAAEQRGRFGQPGRERGPSSRARPAAAQSKELRRNVERRHNELMRNRGCESESDQ